MQSGSQFQERGLLMLLEAAVMFEVVIAGWQEQELESVVVA